MTGVEKRILDFWEAVDRIDPLPDPWLQTSLICQEIRRIADIEIAKGTGEVTPSDYTDFMPSRWLGSAKPSGTEAQSAEEQSRILDATTPKEVRS